MGGNSVDTVIAPMIVDTEILRKKVNYIHQRFLTLATYENHLEILRIYVCPWSTINNSDLSDM